MAWHLVYGDENAGQPVAADQRGKVVIENDNGVNISKLTTDEQGDVVDEGEEWGVNGLMMLSPIASLRSHESDDTTRQ